MCLSNPLAVAWLGVILRQVSMMSMTMTSIPSGLILVGIIVANSLTSNTGPGRTHHSHETNHHSHPPTQSIVRKNTETTSKRQTMQEIDSKHTLGSHPNESIPHTNSKWIIFSKRKLSLWVNAINCDDAKLCAICCHLVDPVWIRAICQWPFGLFAAASPSITMKMK